MLQPRRARIRFSIAALIWALAASPLAAQSFDAALAGERLRVAHLDALRTELTAADGQRFAGALDTLAASEEPGVLDVWERAIATADEARRPQLVRRFAAVRDRLTRRERVAQVVRLAASRAQVEHVQRALEVGGAALHLTVWQDGTDHIIAALPPASQMRLAAAGVAAETLFNSVAEWEHAHRAGVADAQHIAPRYQSDAAARDYLPRIIVFDLANSTADAVHSLLVDRENVVARNDGFLAYLDLLPTRRPGSYLHQRYRRRGLRIAAVIPVDKFDSVGRQYFPEMDAAATTTSAAGFDGQFHSYEEVTAELQGLAALYPDKATLVSLGPTYEGREIWALKISQNVSVDDPSKPDILFTGCHHAREWISVEPPMYFAHRLLDDYATDGAIRYFVDHTAVWLVPIVNPDGLAYSQRSANASSDSVRFWRKNRRPISVAGCGSGVGVDLNRNYAYAWRLPSDRPCPVTYDDNGASDDPRDFQLYRGPTPLSELEVQALATLTANPAYHFISRVDFHNYSQLVLYPWNYGTNAPPDATTLAHLGTLLAQRLTATNAIHYTPEPGVGLYVATGTSVDHAYGIDHTIGAFIWELRPASCCFYVPESQIDPIDRETWNGARTLLDWSVGPPYLAAVEARQRSAGAAFDQIVYEAAWNDAASSRTLTVATRIEQLQSGPLRVTLHFSKPLPVSSAPQVTLGRIAPFNEVTATVTAADEGWQTTEFGTDTWVGEVVIPAYGDGTQPWQLAVRVQDGAGLALDAQPATLARYGFGSDHWLDAETGADLQHSLPPSASLGPWPPVTVRPSVTPTPVVVRSTPVFTRTPTPTTNTGLANDTCAGAKVVSSTPFSDVELTTAATTAATDPYPACGSGSRAKSVWYQFTPPTNGRVTADTFGSNYDTILSVFAGGCGSFSGVTGGCNDDAASTMQSQVSFDATAGVSYYFMVSAYSGNGGTLSFHLSFQGTAVTATATPIGYMTPTPTMTRVPSTVTPTFTLPPGTPTFTRPPATPTTASTVVQNDTCVGAIAVPALPYSNTELTTLARTDSNDPYPPCGNMSRSNSVWYRFTAATTGVVTASTYGSNYDTLLSAYTGSCGALVSVPAACNDDTIGLTSQVSFTATAGTTYYLMVTSYIATSYASSGGGTLVFSMR